FSYMADVLERKFDSSSALLSLAQHREIGPELEYFLNAYGLLNQVSITVSSGAGREIVDEPRLRRQLFRAAGIFWFQKESVLLANDGASRMQSIELPIGNPLSSLFRLLWSAQQGDSRELTLKDIHALRSKAPYREHLHAGAAKMLVTRLRQKLKPAALTVSYDRPRGTYSLQSALPCLTILSGSEAPARDRKAEILARIEMEPFVRTTLLREELGVSRQALHSYLKELCEEGKIRLVSRGPSSGYIFTGK
ncbi:MAG: HTH domain-containing protein, partial [Proteobacteria bacterium]